MMQKVQGLTFAFIYFNELFHYYFSFPLRYFLYSSDILFGRPY